MVESGDEDDWVGQLGGFVTNGGTLHLIVGLGNSCDPSHPAIELGSDGQDWGSVVLGRVGHAL